jgi:hypothetical protein
MELNDLAENIIQGKLYNRSELTSSPTNILYLLPTNLKSNLITEENAKYLISKKVPRSDYMVYGDIVIYHKADNDFGIFRFVQELNKNIIPSPDFALIRTSNSFLINLVQNESGKSYIKGEIQELWKHKDGNWKNVISELKNIDIPLIFEGGDISVSPGNIPVEKSDLAKISIRKGLISNDNLIKRVKNGEIRIDGYFQRKSKLWDEGIKSRFIEALILDIPVPPLYFDIVSKSEWLIIDGLQRISTIVDFYNDKFELSELDFLPELNTKKFSVLDRDTQRSFEEAELTTFAIQPGTPRTVRYKIFKNINTSALVLTRQEIRHAMNEDEKIVGFTPSRYIKELADILNKFINISNSDIDRMYDRELALRYVTFRMFYYKVDYKPSSADFLDKAMDNMYSYPKNKLELYKGEFAFILKTLKQLFTPEILFTKKMIASKEDETETRNVINGSLFEIWTYAISQLSKLQINKLLLNAEQVNRKTISLKNDNNFVRSIDPRYSNSIEMVKIRFATITNLINDVINDN